MTQIENPTPQWLKNLQENSWQMELFISGGAIFSLFQLSDFVLDWILTAQSLTYNNGVLNITGIFSLMGVNLLSLGFFIHLLLRTYWIGLVCLNAVFPNGPNLKKLKFSYPFSLKKINEGILVNQIEKLDRYTGLVFFFTIICTLLIAGVIILFSFLFLPYVLWLELEDQEEYQWVDWIILLLVFPIIFYFIDLILFGFIRKIKWISIVIFPFFWIFDRITLRFLYNHPLQVYSSNINKFKSSIILIIAIAFSLFLSIARIPGGSSIIDRRKHSTNPAGNSQKVNQGNYLDEIYQADEKTRYPKIQSMVISDPFLKIYIPYRKFYDTFLSDSTSLPTIIGISIDNDTIIGIEWHNYKTVNDKYLNGILGMHDIQDLPRGKHELVIFKKENALIEEDTADLNKFRRNIIFWKE